MISVFQKKIHLDKTCYTVGGKYAIFCTMFENHSRVSIQNVYFQGNTVFRSVAPSDLPRSALEKSKEVFFRKEN